MLYLIYAVHVLICLFLILVVLLQQGSGADLSVFGGGGTQTAFGARSATSLLHKLTVAGFIGFILTTIAIGFLKSGGSSGSVMSGVEQPAAEAQAAEEGAEPSAPADQATDEATAEDASQGAADGAEAGEAALPDPPAVESDATEPTGDGS